MSRSLRRAFTLVEMLVVIGIIGVLAALLLPAVMMAINVTRRGAIATEIAELAKAVESYREKHDDYPPNFRDYDAFIRHVNKCYPQAAKNIQHMNLVINAVWPGRNLNNPPPAGTIPMIDEGESLVFWLYLVENDKRQPFQALLKTSFVDVLNGQKPERLFPFKEERLIDGADGDFIPSYKSLYSGETAYLYIDSRSYDDLTDDYTTPNRAAYAEDPSAGYIRPYWSETRTSTAPVSPPDLRDDFKPMKDTSFQIICAGQDGLFQTVPEAVALKFFPGGGGYTTDDNDNITNFSEGARLEDKLP
jgi:prepilin-type N-terminal cleavage/methylation domain-containing protein